MKLEVITGTSEEFAAAAAQPDCERSMAGYKAYVAEKLSEAESAGIRTACLQSIPMAEKASDNFAAIGWVEQAVKEFQAEHELPETVRIVCDSDETAMQYKVVYNMFYADSKATRLQDDKWD